MQWARLRTMRTVQGLDFNLEYIYFYFKINFSFTLNKFCMSLCVREQCTYYSLLLIEEIEKKCNFKMCKKYKFPV